MQEVILFRLPKLYENMDEGTIGKWLFQEGDIVKKGDPLVDLVTDKTNESFDAPADGTILKLFVPEKSVVPVGYIIACIGDPDMAVPDVENENKQIMQEHQSQVTGQVEEPSEPYKVSTVSKTAKAVNKVRIAPAARAMIKKENVDLDALAAHVGDRVIHKRDVEEFLKASEKSAKDSSDGQPPVALITGASGDIGRAIALTLAEAGFQLALHFNTNKDAAKAIHQQVSESGSKAKSFQADLTSSASCKELLQSVQDSFSRIDVLVNNAGLLDDAMLSFMTDEQWERVIQTNLNSAFYMSREVAMIMARQRAGKIINIASDAGRLGSAGRSNYAAAKAGLAGFTRSIARELAGSNIQANTISPGFIESRMTSDYSDKKRKDLHKEIPARRFGSPEDVAELVCFLASDKSNYITGQDISIDGGLYMG